MSHAEMKHLRLLLVLLLLLLLLLLLEGEAILIIARKLLQSPTAAAGENPLFWNYWKCNCVSRKNSVDVVIMNRSIDQTGNVVHEICIGDLIIFNHN